MTEDVPGRRRGHLQTGRAASFGSVADLYDRIRPGYPDALAAALCPAGPLTVLDIGCGTGKAALPFLGLGCSVLGVDPDEKMAAIAEGRGLSVEVASFEEWEPAGRRFDLVIAGQAWHWVDPGRGPGKAAEALAEGGRLAPFWNYRSPEAALLSRIEPIYRRLAPALLENSPLLGTADRDEELSRYAAAIETSGLFEAPEMLSFSWSTSYPPEDWVALSKTTSDHRLLGQDDLDHLLAEVAEALSDREDWRVDYETAVLVAPGRR